MNMKKNLAVVCLYLLPFMTTVKANETNDFTLPKIKVQSIKDTQANRQYELYIKLPEGYAENKDKIYPVIYFTDAIWHIEILSAATEYLMEDAILVGISWQKDINGDLKKEYGAHVSRYRDYSMRKSSNPETQAKHQLGQASNHLDFIRNDVIKTIDNNYRTNPDRRSYFGYSAGGEFGAYILMTQPDTFNNYILGSPAIKGDIPFLSKLGLNTALKSKDLNANVFISYGTLEKEAGEHIEEFITLLKKRKDKSLALEHVVIDGSHQSAFPMTGIRSVTWLSNLTREKK
jgi:predicted alpha/beta superfamily hydrolase